MNNSNNSKFDDIIEFLDRTIASFRGSLNNFRENSKETELPASKKSTKDKKNRKNRTPPGATTSPRHSLRYSALNSLESDQHSPKKFHTMLHIMKPDELTGVKKGNITFGLNTTHNHNNTSHEDNKISSSNTNLGALPKFDYPEKIEILPSSHANIPSITLTTVSLPHVHQTANHISTCPPPRKVKMVNEKLPISCLRDRSSSHHHDRNKSVHYVNGSSLVASKIKSAYNKVSNKGHKRDQHRKSTILPTINEQPLDKKDPPYHCSTHFAEVLEEM
ncbi:hypothetical protein TrispH2_004940 [Trichoplax sp. H2]|nr:hypothetical protein TrispH2_004940 [Trichoplax sp. H2]|eukprot:RDD42960.1 hypothetical protein TrispH2_004940 [Trichoplax sp. H2]